MGLVIIIGLLIWGWAEMSTFIFIGSKFGGLLNFSGIVLTAFIGVFLLKHQGLSALSRIRSEIARGHTPIKSIADSISLVFGGGLMLIPGYVTDTVGLLLFIPKFRTLFGAYLLQWIRNSNRFTSYVSFGDASFKQQEHGNFDVNDRHEHFNFADRNHQAGDSNIIIEGEAEERPNIKSQLNQKNNE